MKNLKHIIKESSSVSLFEGKIESEKDFREFAKSKFEEVFGDDLDKERMEFTIDGFLKKNKEKAEAGEWGELVGMFNKSFGK